MNISTLINKGKITKQIFILKPPERDGLILQLHHTIHVNLRKQRIRFIHTSFDKTGNLLAAADYVGNIIIIDLLHNKHWALPTVITTCTILKFSQYVDSDIIVGIKNGTLYLINIETGEATAEFVGHTQPVTELSFSHYGLCISTSQSEAIIWDLKSNSKLHVLRLLQDCIIKHALFMPVSGNILACFDDDTMVVWKHKTFEVCKQIESNSWSKNNIKTISFTRNGRAMVFSGHNPELTIVALDTWDVARIIILPEYIHAISRIDFVTQLFDGGSNKVLAILSRKGILYFFDIEYDKIINKIVVEDEITKFDCSLTGKYIACILKSGELNIYSGNQYIQLEQQSRSAISQNSKKKSTTAVKKYVNRLGHIQKQIKDVLDVDKLRAIVKEYGEYPEAYRLKIWTQLLQLPNNKQLYNSFINHTSHNSFETLAIDFPLENKLALQNLRKLLSNLLSWCPHFAHVTYLPILVFPFMKIFQNEPVVCFEAVCTIILNWCQHWFEYFPLPPINILAIVENLLLEHDSDLLNHFTVHNVTSKIYGWPLLESAFSEVFTLPQWYRLWDHILSNEPAFLLAVVAAYSIVQRQALMFIESLTDFEGFYRKQNVVDIKRLITKSYALFNSTTDKNHPRRYLENFKSLEVGPYPNFTGFPKILMDFEFGELNELKKEEELLKEDVEAMLLRKKIELEKIEAEKRKEIETERLKELEKICKKRINQETARVREQRRRISELKRQLQEEEISILNRSREKVETRNLKEKQSALEQLLKDVEQTRVTEEIEVTKAESDLIRHYSELLHYKIKLEEALNVNQPTPGLSSEYKLLKHQQQKLAESLNTIQKEANTSHNIKTLSIATGISAMDDLISRIEIELANQMADRCANVSKNHTDVKVLKLESETKQLEMEVSKLLGVLADLKSQETKLRLNELQDSITTKRKQPFVQGNRYMRQQMSHGLKKDVSYISSFGDEFAKLKSMIREAHAPPSPKKGKEDDSVSEQLAVISL